MLKYIIYEEVDLLKEETIIEFYSDFTYRCPHWTEDDFSQWRLDYDSEIVQFRHNNYLSWCTMGRIDNKLYKRLIECLENMEFEKAVLE